MSDAKAVCEMWRYPAAARYLGIAETTLRRKVMELEVPFYRPFGLKGRVLFSPRDLEEFVQASKVPAAVR